MKQPSAAAQKKQYDIQNDTPFDVPVGKKVYKCRYTKDWTSHRISIEIVNASPNPIASVSEMVNLMSTQITLQSKVLSLLILEKPWKIRLFHWYFWRKLYRTTGSRDKSDALLKVYEALDLGFFFQNTQLIVEMNTLKKRMTKTELKQLSQELQSERKPAS